MNDSYLSLLTTNHSWKDLTLDNDTMKQVEEVKNFVSRSASVKRNLFGNKLNPGYRVLLSGPTGTSMSSAAALIGREVNKPVYRVDLSKIVSKYIGETEKNLESLFAGAEAKGWILFFDEADALFGKRTEVKDSHDRYANIETSYLLQRLENFKGLAILATNNKSNIDSAFTRRLNAVIHIPSS